MYIVLEIQIDSNGTVSHLFDTFNTANEADSKYYQVLSYAAVSNLPLHSAAILTPDGYTQKCQAYKHEVQPEPEPESEEVDNG